MHHPLTFPMAHWQRSVHRKIKKFYTFNIQQIQINAFLFLAFSRTFLYLVFVLFLGSTCKRETLLTNFLIAKRVSAVEFLLLAGVYVSSMSSCLGAMYGTPRVLQSIALENVIPGIGALGQGVSTDN